MPEHKEITYDDYGVACIYCKECDDYYTMEEHCLNCGFRIDEGECIDCEIIKGDLCAHVKE
jgi:hypothetical protein